MIEVSEPDHEDPLILIQDDRPTPGVVDREFELPAVPRVNMEPRDVDQALELDPGANGNEGDHVGGNMHSFPSDQKPELTRRDDDLGTGGHLGLVAGV